MKKLHETIRHLYHGSGARARRYRIALLTFDLAILAFFIVTTVVPDPQPVWLRDIEIVIAALIFLDMSARYWVTPNRARFFRQVTALIDVVIIITLILPFFLENLAFLRVLRSVALLRSFHVLRDLRAEYKFVQKNEEMIQSVINLTVFVLVVSSIVYVLQAHVAETEIRNFIDALYFTVATLTTTGFGDITMKGDWGHLLAVGIMTVGLALFLRVLQTIFRPQKVHTTCPDCGLSRHEPDATHCKHCGHVIFISSEGE